MGLFGNSGSPASLTPPGIGSGPSSAQMSMFAQAANNSGLTDLALSQVDNMTNGLRNEDQVQILYHLMAIHPNEVALFFLHYPNFMAEFANLIALIVRKELYAWFNSGALNTPLNAERAMDYSSITQENIDAQIAKVIPRDQFQQEVNEADMKAINMMNGQQNHLMQQQYNQQMQQQQYQQQMMMQQQMPQRQGLGGALGSFTSNLVRGSLGLPPAVPMQQQGYPPQGMMQQQQ